ncbi:DUF2946 family protein [Methylocystis echinoides]|uniref:DUF2946 family protein n=1 Tax=Methylocystis echinoides TaxID=29468 RepID=UPI0034337DCC
MPRRWLTFALFALALAVQAITPAANGVATAHEAFGLSEICLNAAAEHASQKAPGHTHRHHRHHDCALCQSFCDGVAPVAARPMTLGVRSVDWAPVQWAASERLPVATPRDFARQARAPPSFS